MDGRKEGRKKRGRLQGAKGQIDPVHIVNRVHSSRVNNLKTPEKKQREQAQPPPVPVFLLDAELDWAYFDTVGLGSRTARGTVGLLSALGLREHDALWPRWHGIVRRASRWFPDGTWRLRFDAALSRAQGAWE